jgi:hypothetical protein
LRVNARNFEPSVPDGVPVELLDAASSSALPAGALVFSRT